MLLRNSICSEMRRCTTFLGVILHLMTILWVSFATNGAGCNYKRSEVDRPHSVSISEFGAVGDGVTLNTLAFQNALFYLNSFSDKGGAQLFVPAGKWLTGSFSLISHLTLSLHKDAVIIGSMDPIDWPLIDPLPSYGRGRELPGRRHQSLIHGYNLTDVIITGDNGTIEGQGSVWWDRFNNQTLHYTRPHLIEMMHSTGIVVTNLTFKNSPFWAIHPVYCSQVFIQNLTILAPADSPNTDGIDPDSSSNVCIEDCYMSIGDDLISIKSGWDEYGISFARPSSNITIRRISGSCGVGAGIALGSEMSGGISEIMVEHLHISNSLHGIQIKTSPGRGGYIRNIYIAGIIMTHVRIAVRIRGEFGEHPDENFNPAALPAISKITIRDVVGSEIGIAGLLEGIQGDSFSDICLSNIVLNVTSTVHNPWSCLNIEGYSNLVCPKSCEPLRQEAPVHSSVCYAAESLRPQGSVLNLEAM